MSEETATVESFRMKIFRMFLPLGSEKKRRTKSDPDWEIIDPLERMENAIRRESEAKGKDRSEKSN